MAEIRFYHLLRSDLSQVLPQLLSKALSGGRRVVVRTGDAGATEKIAADLWTFHSDAFLPHGTAADGFAADQPVWITPGNDNPNGAAVLVLTGLAAREDLAGYDLVCDLFDGRDDSEIAAARARWADLKSSGAELTYWQQTESGGWEKKA